MADVMTFVRDEVLRILSATHHVRFQNEMLADPSALSDEASCVAREITKYLNFEKVVLVSLWNGVYTASMDEWDGPMGKGMERVALVQIGPSAMSSDPTCLDVIESRRPGEKVGGVFSEALGPVVWTHDDAYVCAMYTNSDGTNVYVQAYDRRHDRWSSGTYDMATMGPVLPETCFVQLGSDCKSGIVIEHRLWAMILCFDEEKHFKPALVSLNLETMRWEENIPLFPLAIDSKSFPYMYCYPGREHASIIIVCNKFEGSGIVYFDTENLEFSLDIACPFDNDFNVWPSMMMYCKYLNKYIGIGGLSRKLIGLDETGITRGLLVVYDEETRLWNERGRFSTWYGQDRFDELNDCFQSVSHTWENWRITELGNSLVFATGYTKWSILFFLDLDTLKWQGRKKKDSGMLFLGWKEAGLERKGMYEANLIWPFRGGQQV